MPDKSAELQSTVQLQPHQQALANQASQGPLRKLLFWDLGSGKTLGALAGAEANQAPYTAVVPAALRPNVHQEYQRFTDTQTPLEVLSYNQLARGKAPQHEQSLIFDEAHRLRNPDSEQARKALAAAKRAKQVLLLSGTPIINSPGDLAVPVSMLTGQHMEPQEFEERFTKTEKVQPGLLGRLLGITPGEQIQPTNIDELKSLLQGKVDHYAPEQDVVPVQREDIEVPMSLEQSRLYSGMWKELPWLTRWKLSSDFPLSSEELLRLRSFLTGPRQVSLSTYPFLKRKDPHRAFQQSPKLQKAFELLQEQLKDPRSKALVFSNFIDAGLTPYAAALQKAGIPHGVFHGGLDDKARKALVDEYNANKLRVALIGPAGTEGLSFKGTQLVQQLDPHFHPIRPRQAEGRALRYDSHTGLPDELRNVKIQRFISRLPAGLAERLLALLSWRQPRLQEATDDHLLRISRHKENLNEHFLQVLRDIGRHRS